MWNATKVGNKRFIHFVVDIWTVTLYYRDMTTQQPVAAETIYYGQFWSFSLQTYFMARRYGVADRLSEPEVLLSDRDGNIYGWVPYHRLTAALRKEVAFYAAENLTSWRDHCDH